MLIGLTGRNAAGKTTVVNWFADRGFKKGSCSDSIRTWLTKKGLDSTRENLIQGGRDLRSMHGPGILAEMLLEEFQGQNAIVDSIRTTAEVNALRERGDFYLIEIRADQDVRWERSRERSREGDPLTKADFIDAENEELVSKDEVGQSLIATAELADYVIENDGDVESLELILQAFLDGHL
tara:strand:+ start:3018 stop:3560 length:543 start_codon:yes stop_codon:yes gene_type:complete